MTQKRKSKKGLYLLIFLGLFSFFAVRISNTINERSDGSTVDASAPEECTSCGGIESKTTEEKIVNDEINYEQIVELDESQSVNITNMIDDSQSTLGIFTSCKESYANVLSLEGAKACSGGAGNLNYEDGEAKNSAVLVSKNAQFELVEVWYPLAFWLGQYVYENSNKEITAGSSEYRSNGEQIDETYQSRTLSPEEAKTFRNDISPTVRKNFAMEGSITASADTVEENPTGTYVVRNPLNSKNKCSPEVAVSDYNVGKSNYIASDKENGGYLRMQAPGGDNYRLSSDAVCVTEGAKYDEIKFGNVLACSNKIALIKGWFSSVFGINQWKGCHEGEVKCDGEEIDPKTGATVGTGCKTVKTAECISTEDIAVQMPAIFGDPYKCETEKCANAFMTYTYKATLSPEQAKNTKVSSENTDNTLMTFVATPCKAQIVGTNTIINIKCLWDSSQTLFSYRAQKIEKAPSGDDFPETYEKYWENTKVSIGTSAAYYGLL